MPPKKETAEEARLRVAALLATGEPDRELQAAEPELRRAREEFEAADRVDADMLRLLVNI